MLTLPHTLVAAAIVKLFPNPLISLPLALTSHFILDFLVVHWNPHIYTEFAKDKRVSQNSLNIIILDGILALGFCLFILFKFWTDWSTIALFAASIFLSTLPDTIEIPYYFFNSKLAWLKRYVEFEHEHQSNGSFFWGIITQLVLVSLSLIVFFY